MRPVATGRRYLSLKVSGEAPTEAITKAGKDERASAIKKGQVKPDATVYTGVSVDGGWCTRSRGHRYTAKSGHGTIIGEATGNLSFLGIRNKYCSYCANAMKQKNIIPAHTCYKNWDESFPAMEPDIFCEGFIRNEEMHNMQFLKVVADGGSNVIA